MVSPPSSLSSSALSCGPDARADATRGAWPARVKTNHPTAAPAPSTSTAARLTPSTVFFRKAPIVTLLRALRGLRGESYGTRHRRDAVAVAAGRGRGRVGQLGV